MRPVTGHVEDHDFGRLVALVEADGVGKRGLVGLIWVDVQAMPPVALDMLGYGLIAVCLSVGHVVQTGVVGAMPPSLA